MRIEQERPHHIAAIHNLLVDAFPTDAEARLVDALRADGDAVISLVCMDGPEVVGHILYSAMTAQFRALALAPLAVARTHRQKGIATRLIEEGLGLARAQNWDGIFVLGEPEFYSRFGFSVDEARGYDSPYAGEYFMLLALGDTAKLPRTGAVAHAPAFTKLS